MSDRKKLNRARLEVAQAMAQTMDLYGYSPSTGMIFSLLYFSEEALSLDELAEKLELSKTTISNGSRSMEERGLLNKSWKLGNRRDYYQAETDFFSNFKNYFSSMWQREIDVNLKAIAKAEPLLRELYNSNEAGIKRLAESDLKKLEEAKKYYHWLDKMVKTLENEEIFKLIPLENSK